MALDDTDSSDKSIDKAGDSGSDSKALSQSVWDDMKSSSQSSTAVLDKSDSTKSDTSSGTLDCSSAHLYGDSDAPAGTKPAGKPADANPQGDSSNSAKTGDSTAADSQQTAASSDTKAAQTTGADTPADSKPQTTSPDTPVDSKPPAAGDTASADTGSKGDSGTAADSGPLEGGKGKGARDAVGDKAGGDTSAPGGDLSKESKQVMSDLDKLNPPVDDAKKDKMRQDLAEIDKLPEDQRKKVMESMDNLAKPGDSKTHITDQQRGEIVTSMAHQIAHPEDIRQGDKDTCVGANAEKTMAHNHPDTYADMVNKLSTTGEYTAPGGKHITQQLDSDGKLPANDDKSNERSAASEIFQSGAMNLGMKDGDTYKSFMPGKAPDVTDGGKNPNPSDDQGERVVHSDGKVSSFDGLPAGSKEDILNQLAPNDKYTSKPVNSGDDLIKAYDDNGGDKHPPLNVTMTLGSESAGFSGMGDSSNRLTKDQIDTRVTQINNDLNHTGLYTSDADRARLEKNLSNLNPSEAKALDDAYFKKYNKHIDEDAKSNLGDSYRDVNKQEYSKIHDMLNQPEKAPTHAVSIDHIDKGPPAMVYYENTADTGGTNHSYPKGTPVPMDDFVKAMKAGKGTATVHDGQYPA